MGGSALVIWIGLRGEQEEGLCAGPWGRGGFPGDTRKGPSEQMWLGPGLHPPCMSLTSPSETSPLTGPPPDGGGESGVAVCVGLGPGAGSLRASVGRVSSDSVLSPHAWTFGVGSLPLFIPVKCRIPGQSPGCEMATGVGPASPSPSSLSRVWSPSRNLLGLGEGVGGPFVPEQGPVPVPVSGSQ